MRIIGYIEGTPYKITVFKMDHRFTVKFETAAYEQSFKLRESDTFQNIQDIESFVKEVLPSVKARFTDMHQTAGAAIAALVEERDEVEEFEYII